ncbi:hypothetical protein OG203_06250 [Nocardia sp. NBC_01499]|uniref:hypothetical protein n=1 Tax=Nocardia sp. NBC_01499 TaxID=2903597 RepID=UPI00386D0A84
MSNAIAIIAAVTVWEALILWVVFRFMSRESQWKVFWTGTAVAAFVFIKEMPWWVSIACALPLGLVGWFVIAVLQERRKAPPIPDLHCKICGGALFRPRRLNLTMHKYGQDARLGQRNRNHSVVIEPGPPVHDWIEGRFVTRA